MRLSNVASPVALVSLLAVSIMAVAACTAGGTSYSGLLGDDGGAGRSGDGGVVFPGGSDGGNVDTPTCTPDPSCERAYCTCVDQSVVTTDGVCLPGGSCDVVDRCKVACGSAKFDISLQTEKTCSNEGDTCSADQPTVTCACDLDSVDAYPRCTDGYCSSASQNVCPATCQSMGGWTCQGADDCTPVVCACNDGLSPAVAGSCLSGGSCAPKSATCPSACTSHGGWAGSGTVTPGKDAGSTGPKAPGAACTQGAECSPFDCGCNDGSSFKGIKSCQSHVCATKSQACSLTCTSSGGWNGL